VQHAFCSEVFFVILGRGSCLLAYLLTDYHPTTVDKWRILSKHKWVNLSSAIAWLCVSTSGANPAPAWLPLSIAKGFEIHCGFDADQTGDTLADKMISRYPSIKRLRPIQRDWNDQLRLLPITF